MTAETTLNLLTLSFRGDYEFCRLLCETVDRFVPAEVSHLVAVPHADLTLFASLAGRRRTVVAQEDLLPSWLLKLPLPGPAWRARLRLPHRNMYIALPGRLVRGWIAQQIMKLAAAAASERDLIFHLDSDAAFVRPLPVECLYRGGKARLHRIPEAGQTPMHAAWHRAASTLLGIPMRDYHGADYVDSSGVTWRQPVVRALLARLESIGRADWRRVLSRPPDFSEYTLYGVFCDHVMGLDAADHFGAPVSLSRTIWPEPAMDEARAMALVQDVEPHHLLVGIQSTIAMPMTARRRIVEAAVTRAAAQDAERAGAA